MAGLDGNVSDGVTLTSSDKVADSMVTEQFAGLVNSWTGRYVKSRNAIFKITFILII